MINTVALSGGKDSTAMLHILLENNVDIHKVYFFDTEWEFPEMENHLKLIEKKTKLHIEIIRYYRKFDDLLLYYGWPKTSGGWCTACKRDTCIKYERGIHTNIVYIGFSADEEHRAHRDSIYISRNWKIKFPLIENKITEKAALKYCYNLGYNWDGLYEIFDRVSCFCCPKAGKKRIEALKNNFPLLYEEYLRKINSND